MFVCKLRSVSKRCEESLCGRDIAKASRNPFEMMYMYILHHIARSFGRSFYRDAMPAKKLLVQRGGIDSIQYDSILWAFGCLVLCAMWSNTPDIQVISVI